MRLQDIFGLFRSYSELKDVMRVSAPETSVRAMKISEFQTKDVINIVDGRRLGQISDLEIDVRQGKIEAIVVPGSSRFMGWFGGEANWLFRGATL